MDSTKYVNTYLDFAVSMIHEAVNEKLQNKTQLKLANDLVAERDQVISSLKTEVENLKKQSTDNVKTQDELTDAKKKAKHWEDSYHGLSNKVSHFDTLTNQFNDLKNQFQKKDVELQTLRTHKDNELQTLRTQKDTELQTLKTQKDNEIQAVKNEKNNLEESIRVKNSQYDILNAKVSDLNNSIQVKDLEIQNLKTDLEALTKKLESQKKQINTSRKKSSSSAQVVPVLDFSDKKDTTDKPENNDF